MNAQQQLDIAEQRLEKAVEDVKIAIREAREEIKNKRLSRTEVEELMEYKSQGYTYMIEPSIPFDSAGFITYKKLKKWVAEHKPSRLKRLKRNYKTNKG